jgi:hypothetical protein
MNTPNQPANADPVALVTNLALGYLISRALHVATELGIADWLKDGPQSVEQLAAATGAQPLALQRLLRTLAAHGVLAEVPGGRFASTPAAQLLQRGVMRDGVLLCGEVSGDGAWWNAVGALRHSVMTGAPAFEHQHGVGFFEYLRERPACAQWFDRGMANFSAAENPAIAAAYDFGRFRHVLDVGGGQGGLLAEILARHPGVRGTLFDLAAVVRNPFSLQEAVSHERWSTAEGDFFQAVPSGGDAYVLKRILHDWSDAQCVQILRNCRAAMGTNARLLIVDAVLPEGNAAHPAKIMDILMMVFAGGRERTQREFDAILSEAGFRLHAVTPTASMLSIVEAAPA